MGRSDGSGKTINVTPPPAFTSSTSGAYSLGPLGFLPQGVSFAAGSASGVIGNMINNNPQLVLDVASWLTGTSYTNLQSATSIVRSALEATGGKTQLISIGQGGWDASTNRARSSGGSGGGGGITISMGGSGPGSSDMTASAELSAYSSVLNTLNTWNLDSLSGQAWNMISDPGYHLNAGEVINQLRQTDAYKQAFPGMAEIRAKGLSMTEAQYINHSMDIQDQFANNGINQGYLNPEEIGKLVAGGVYGTNLTTRLQKGYEAIKNFDPYAKKMLQEWYGVTPGHLLAYTLSPKHGMDQIIKHVQSAMIGTEAHLAGFQGLDKNTAQELSKQMTNTGYNMDYFRTGFKQAAGEQPLERAQIGERGQATVSQSQILANTFSGLNQPKGTSVAGNAAALQLAAQARTAGLSGGGGFVQGQRGGEGIGYASSEGTSPAH